MSVAKTRVGCPEEPHLRGVLEVRFRRSSNAHRIAGLSQCVGCGVIQKEECKHLWERKVSLPRVNGIQHLCAGGCTHKWTFEGEKGKP